MKTAREKLDREELALARYDGNITRAASALGISRQAFHDILSKRQIERN